MSQNDERKTPIKGCMEPFLIAGVYLHTALPNPHQGTRLGGGLYPTALLAWGRLCSERLVPCPMGKWGAAGGRHDRACEVAGGLEGGTASGCSSRWAGCGRLR